MERDDFAKYEIQCICLAAGRPGSDVQPIETPGGLRSRTYHLRGPDGGTFVKCLDSGYLNPASFYPTLNREAEAYQVFRPLADERFGLPDVHFSQSFEGADGQLLQVLGMSNLGADGAARSLRDLYLDPQVPLHLKEQAAGDSGGFYARLVSAVAQERLDLPVAMTLVRKQTEKLLSHPNRAAVLDLVDNHEALPWAYQNRVLGEMNVLVPMWLSKAGEHADAHVAKKLETVGRAVTDASFIESLSPGKSADKVIVSPHDRHDGNTILVMMGDQVGPLYEVDMEFWGLETIGRMIGRYCAVQASAVRDQSCVGLETRQVSGTIQAQYRCLMGAFLYHFIRGDGADSAEVALRAIGVGLGGYHAALMWLYVSAIFPQGLPIFVEDMLYYLNTPTEFLAMAADHAETRPGDEAEMVIETIGQVWMALNPLKQLTETLIA